MDHERTLARIHQALGPQARAGAIDTTDWPIIRDNIGRLVVDALNDPVHPLYDRVGELREFIAEYEANIATARRARQRLAGSAAEPSARIWFMPQPGMPGVRRFWTLQLLLFIAAQSTSKQVLAQQLSMPAYRLEQAAQCGRAHSIANWSVNQFLPYLRTAIEEFEEMAPQPPTQAAGFKLRGRELVADERPTEPVRLSKAEAAFLRTLAERCPSAVPHKVFERAGISPVDTKKRLLRKLKGHQIELHIASPKGAYVLTTSITIAT